jgi:hypothetical protein
VYWNCLFRKLSRERVAAEENASTWILVNQLRFLNQDPDRATKLISSLKYSLLKGFNQTKPGSRYGHKIRYYSIIDESSCKSVNPRPTPYSQFICPSLYILLKDYVNIFCWLANDRGNSAFYIVISTVLVKLWSNTGTRGCHNPTKTNTLLASLSVFKYILLKDGVNVVCYIAWWAE